MFAIGFFGSVEAVSRRLHQLLVDGDDRAERLLDERQVEVAAACAAWTACVTEPNP